MFGFAGGAPSRPHTFTSTGSLGMYWCLPDSTVFKINCGKGLLIAKAEPFVLFAKTNPKQQPHCQKILWVKQQRPERIVWPLCCVRLRDSVYPIMASRPPSDMKIAPSHTQRINGFTCTRMPQEPSPSGSPWIHTDRVATHLYGGPRS